MHSYSPQSPTPEHDDIPGVPNSRQPMAPTYNPSVYEDDDHIRSYGTSQTGIQQSPYAGILPNGYGNTSPTLVYNSHAISDHSSGWPSSVSSHIPRSRGSTHGHTDSSAYGALDGQRHTSQARTDTFYPQLDRGSYAARQAPSSMYFPDFNTTSDRYRVSAASPYPSGYDRAHLALSHTTPPIHGAQSNLNMSNAYCQWTVRPCGMIIDDSSPSGISRHLRQYHDVVVTDNRNRGMCAWGGRCGKDMFPSSYGKHIAECHFRNMTRTCQYCGADFARADTLSRHVKAFCPNTAHGGGHAH